MRSQTQRLRGTTEGSRPEEVDFRDWGALKIEKKAILLTYEMPTAATKNIK